MYYTRNKYVQITRAFEDRQGGQEEDNNNAQFDLSLVTRQLFYLVIVLLF